MKNIILQIKLLITMEKEQKVGLVSFLLNFYVSVKKGLLKKHKQEFMTIVLLKCFQKLQQEFMKMMVRFLLNFNIQEDFKEKGRQLLYQ